MLRYGIWLGVLMAIAGVADGVLAQSVIVPDETLGGERSVVTPLDAQTDVIEGGAARGINLFQSFREFNVGEGRTIYFTSPNLEIQNIFARVTGANPSEILGRLGTALIDGNRLDNSNASLFLINPNGIIFGKTSRLNVDKSFVATTASAIGFGSQGTFSASQPDAPSPILTINPSAFLFSQISPANITVQANRLQVPNGQSLLLLGGNVAIDGGRLNAWEGRIELGAVATPGSIELNPNGSLQFSADINRGDISIINRSNLDTRLDGGGDIAINARNLNIKSSVIQAGIFTDYGTPTTQAGDITLNTTGALAISSQSLIRNWVFSGATGKGGNIFIDAGSLSLTEDSAITAITYGVGSAGNIRIRANGDVRLDAESNIYSLTEESGRGNAGNVEISARNLLVTKGSQLSASTFGKGNGGNVILNTRDAVSLDGTDPTGRFPSAIFSSVQNDAIGQGGDIQITTGSLSITNSAKLDTSVFGTGDGGNVIINARDAVILDGITRGFKYGSAIFSTLEETGRGSAGDIRISTGSLSILNGAAIQSLTQNQGNAGNIFINARDSVVIDGGSVQDIDRKETGELFITIVSSEVRSGAIANSNGNGGNIFINAGNEILVNSTGRVASGKVLDNDSDFLDVDYSKFSSRSVISSSVEENAIGQAGNIRLETGFLFASNDARIISTTSGVGNSGNINILVRGKVFLDNDAVIGTLVNDEGVGNAGKIEIIAGELLIKDAAQIDSSTFGQGNAGNVVINVSDAVVITGNKRKEGDKFITTFSSGILSTTERGKTYANAGDISISAGSLLISDGAELQTITARQGNAGNITVQVGSQISLTNDAKINSSTSGQGDAGDISLQANQQVTLDRNSLVTSQVEEGAIGNGGSIFISTGDFIATNIGVLEATTNGRGNAGNITVLARNAVNLSGGIIREDLGEIASSGINSSVEALGIGNAGDILIDSAFLSVQEGGINAFTRGGGDSGNIRINSRDLVFLDRATVASIVGYPRSPGEFGEGAGGEIQINTNSLVLTNGGQLQASTFGQGDAGNIVINARESVSLSGFRELGEDRFYSSMFSVVGENSVGTGGAIQVNTGSLSLTNGAKLSVDTRGQGRAGNIEINARNNVFLDSIDQNDSTSGLFTRTTNSATEQGGNITVNANLLKISNRAVVDAATSTPFRGGNITVNANIVELSKAGSIVSTASRQGNAGSIKINANQARLSDRATISTSTARSDGGDITLNIGDLLLLRRGSSISTTAGTAEAGGNGGNIAFNGGFIIAIPKENSDITANAFTGSGGRVNITSQGIFGLQFRPKLTPLSDITASSEAGLNGTISIATPDDSVIQNNLNQLPADNIDTNRLLSQTCIVRKDQPEGTFHITGIDNIPNRPSDPMPSDYPTSTLQPSNQKPWKVGDPIAEPQGFYRLADGRLVMSRECDRT